MQWDHRMIGEIRGPGLFIGVELVKDPTTKELPTPNQIDAVMQKCLEGGVITVPGKGGYETPEIGNVFKIKPPMAITNAQIMRALDVFEAAITEAGKV